MVHTVKVKPWGKDQGAFVEINEADFDPAVHQLYEPVQQGLAGLGGGEAEQPAPAESDPARGRTRRR